MIETFALLSHPVQRGRLGPVAAQPDLKEAVPAHRAGPDQPAYRPSVPDHDPKVTSPVSACASKWITDTQPWPTCWATPAAPGQARCGRRRG